MTASFTARYRENRRLVLLQILVGLTSYRSNASNLQAGLFALGVEASRDDVHTDLHWLRDQGLVALEEPTKDFITVVLTARGKDVATGQAAVPGVSRPDPT